MKTLLALLPLLLAPPPAAAYDVFLDVDIDGDPGTIHTFADAESAQVRLVLSPTEPDEWITHVGFGLGGTCWECFDQGSPYTYGTDSDIYRLLADWHDSPLIAASWADISLCYGCCNGNGSGDGYHYLFDAVAEGEGFALDAPVFIATFSAWVSRSSIFDRCPHPPANLMTFPGPTAGPLAQGNAILLSDEFTAVEKGSWSAIKALY